MVLEESIRAHATSFVEALEAATLRFLGPEDYNGLIGFGSGFHRFYEVLTWCMV